jgi:tartronate-semialdehyde synthase
VAGGGIINADASDLLVEFAELTGMPVIPTLMGWGTIPDDHPLMAGMCGLQTSHRYGNATMLASDFVLGIGNRWANRHTGSPEVYCKGRKFIHVDIEPTQIGRVFAPDYGIVSDAKAALALFVRGGARDEGRRHAAPTAAPGLAECQQRKRTLLRKTHFDTVPMKPQRVYQCMNNAFGKTTCYVSTIGLSQIAGAQFLHVYKPAPLDQLRPGRPAGLDHARRAGRARGRPDAQDRGAVGRLRLPVHDRRAGRGRAVQAALHPHVVNNSYLGLIRQSQRGFEMDYCVQLAFDNINTPETGLQGYGVDHVKVVEGLGCKAHPRAPAGRDRTAIQQAEAWMAEFRVPVVIEVILERVTNIAMGTEIDNINEFEEIAAAESTGRRAHRRGAMLD